MSIFNRGRKSKETQFDVSQVDRSKHCFAFLGGRWKCLLCGGITRQLPPNPEPADWIPDRYEPLTDEERQRVPFPLK